MHRLKRSLLGLILAIAAIDAWAVNELMIHPTRIMFEGNTRTAQVDLINSGSETAIYRISLIQRRMTETGDFVSIEEPLPGERFADAMIRFSPRQVVLEPGVAQAVRLQLRKPADLDSGEYRSHLLFQVLPPPVPESPVDGSSEHGRPDEVEINLTAIYSISIPVIVRHGEQTVDVSIRDLALHQPEQGPPSVSFILDRRGSRSVYGDITVYLTSGGGPERVIARANGVAVYTPNSLRRAVVPLATLPNGVPSGQLRVTFEERPEQREAARAEGRLTVQ